MRLYKKQMVKISTINAEVCSTYMRDTKLSLTLQMRFTKFKQLNSHVYANAVCTLRRLQAILHAMYTCLVTKEYKTSEA
jgi:hypothetical protein